MTAELFTYGIASALAIVVGAVAGGLTAWRLSRQRAGSEPVAIEPEIDGFIDAAIEMEAVRWQEARALPPEAASLMSAKLKTLTKLSMEKGWL